MIDKHMFDLYAKNLANTVQAYMEYAVFRYMTTELGIELPQEKYNPPKGAGSGNVHLYITYQLAPEGWTPIHAEYRFNSHKKKFFSDDPLRVHEILDREFQLGDRLNHG